MSINDHMKVAIDNIVTLLSSKIVTTTPSAKQNKQLALREAFTHISKLLKTDERSNTQLHQHLAPQPRVLQKVHPIYNPVKHKPFFGPPNNIVSAPRVLQQVPRVLRPSAIFSRQFAQPKPNPNIQPMPPQSKLAQHNAPFHLNHIYDKNGQKINIDKLITTENTKTVWLRGLDNELGRLAQGFAPNNIRGTNTISFIAKGKIQVGKKITYVKFVCDLRPLKKEMHRVRMTVGGDKLDYPHDTASPTAALLDTKLIINSTISDHKKFGSKFCSIDIKDFFLQTVMEDPEFLRIHKRYFSPQFIAQYQLSALINKDGYVYGQINKGMYGLKQAAILAYKQLVGRLKHHGYVPITATNGLWKHITKPTLFALCVDDFGVKYNSMDDLNHLKAALQQHYEITVDMEGKHFCGLSLEWNYDAGYVDVSMPNYVAKKLKKFQHNKPARPQYAPHKWSKPVYGRKLQYTPPPDTSDFLDKKGITRIQSINGSFLYYGRAVDPTILTALNEIATQQSKPTITTEQKAQMLMDYLATYPNAKLRFYAGDMKLHVETDAAYLVLPNVRSRVAGHFYLSAFPTPNKKYPGNSNAPILTECYTLKNVVSSAAEAECGGIFHNCVVAIGIRNALEGMGHPQGKTTVITDNSTATSFVHSAMREKRSKSWDMKYNWLRDRQAQQQFEVKWQKGSTNQADYFTKHHPPSHHKAKRYDYILRGF